MEEHLPALRDCGTGAGAWWKPILAVLRQPCSDTWGYQHKAALKSAIIGRQWPQQRLKQAKLVDDGSCQLCLGSATGPAAGTLLHRVQCPALREYVDSIIPQWMKPHLTGEAHEWSASIKLGLTRGLCPALNLLDRSDSEYDTFTWYARPSGELPLGARLFTDGSLIDGKVRYGCQSLGWAVLVTNATGDLIASATGVPPRWVDTIQGAELWAVRMALLHVAFPDVFYTLIVIPYVLG